MSFGIKLSSSKTNKVPNYNQTKVLEDISLSNENNRVLFRPRLSDNFKQPTEKLVYDKHTKKWMLVKN